MLFRNVLDPQANLLCACMSSILFGEKLDMNRGLRCEKSNSLQGPKLIKYRPIPNAISGLSMDSDADTVFQKTVPLLLKGKFSSNY